MIKFRAWHKTWQEMGKVTCIHFDDKQSVISMFCEEEQTSSALLDDEVILMQSTGLFDKNGQEIFEGDIVKRYKNPLFKAKWEYQIETVVRREAGLLLGKYFGNNLGTISFGLPFTKSDLLEVIGNIYENPELLEVKDE